MKIGWFPRTLEIRQFSSFRDLYSDIGVTKDICTPCDYYEESHSSRSKIACKIKNEMSSSWLQQKRPILTICNLMTYNKRRDFLILIFLSGQCIRNLFFALENPIFTRFFTTDTRFSIIFPIWSIMSTTCLPQPISISLNPAPASSSCTKIGRANGGSRRASRTSSRCEAMPAQPPCYLHPRNDCNIPCCKPPRKCPEGIYVQRVQPFTPDRIYIPPEIPFAGLTTYQENYYLKCGPRSQSFKPAAQFDPSDAKFVGLSSYREQFYPKCAKREPSYKPNVTANFSDSPMRDVSTYRFDYHLKCGPKVESLKPKAQFFPSSAKMDGVTTYRSTFVPYCPREYKFAKQPYANKLMSGDASCAPFDAMTTYRVDYWPKPINKQASLKPNVRPRFSDAKMNGFSTYRHDFNPFTFEKCIDNCVPAQIYDEMYPRCGLFACGAEPEEVQNKVYEDPCPRPPNCPCGPPPPCNPDAPLNYVSCGDGDGVQTGGMDNSDCN